MGARLGSRPDGVAALVQEARALDDLLDATQSVTRTLLGVGVDPAALPASPPPPVPGRVGWMAYPGRRYHP